MSEDRLEQEAKDDDNDVEAHKKKNLNLEATELGSDESDDVEAHRKKSLNLEATELGSDESDDVEAHRKRAWPGLPRSRATFRARPEVAAQSPATRPPHPSGVQGIRPHGRRRRDHPRP